MKKRIISGILTICMLFLSACGNAVVDQNTSPKEGTSLEDAAKQLGELDSLHMANNRQMGNGIDTGDEVDFYREKGGEIALMTGNSLVMDGSYQQAIYEGIITYAKSAEQTYSYYTPVSTEESDFIAAMDEAIEMGAKLVVCGGWDYDIIVGKYQYKHPDINFLIVDGQPEDENENQIEVNSNVHCVYCECTTAGYLAGYLSVIEGYRRFGFMGGEKVDGVTNYGNGFMAGINAAAKEIGCIDEISLKHVYTNTWIPNDDIYNLSCEWYDEGTEVIFSCGGGIYQSVLRAAEEKSAYMIGVDVNQNALSEAVITSAINGVSVCVINALDEYFAHNGWPEDLAGQIKQYGPKDKCASLPFDKDSWKFKNVSIEDYFNLYTKITGGELVVESSLEPPKVDYTVDFVEMKDGE